MSDPLEPALNPTARWRSRLVALVGASLAAAGAGTSSGLVAPAVAATNEETISSGATNGPHDAVGPLRGGMHYGGTLDGGDREDWLHYWHRNPAVMNFRSSCATRVERWSTKDDTFRLEQAVEQFDLGPIGLMSHPYSNPNPTVRRMLLRIVRTDTGFEPCGWSINTVLGDWFPGEPRKPAVTLRAERVGKRTVAIIVRARIQAPRQGARPVRIEVTGPARLTIRTTAPRSGVIQRRVPLPAGRRGTLRVRVSVPATARRTPLPVADVALRVVTARPIVRPPAVRPAPRPPRRPPVRKPRGALTKAPSGIFYFRERPVARPSSMRLAQTQCSIYFTGIRWTSWGSATATGRAQVNAPYWGPNETSCGGAWENRNVFPSTIRLLKPKVCAGTRIFTRIRWIHDTGRGRTFDVSDCPRGRS